MQEARLKARHPGFWFAVLSLLLAFTVGCASWFSDGQSGILDPPDPPPITKPAGYIAADGFNGGQLYDEFWKTETGWDQADPNLATFGDSKDFFKCKQCHGWDLLGNQGAYISRAPKTTRPNVTGLNLHTIAAGMTEQALFDAMKSSTGRRGLTADLSTYDPDTNAGTGDQMPDYGSFMSDADIWDLVKFMKETALDTSTLYDSATTGTYPTGSMAFSNVGKAGNAANGNTVYAANCVGCHGADGTLILVDHDTYTIGSFIRQKANEAQHKIRYGQLGSPMGGLVTDDGDMLDVYKALADATNFPDPGGAVAELSFVDGDGNAVSTLAAGDVTGAVSTQTIKFSATAVDPDGNPLTYTWIADGAGTFTDEAVDDDGVASAFWAADAAGTYTVTVTADNGVGGTASVSATMGLTTDPFAVTALPTEFNYAGYETCGNCHSAKVTMWEATAHSTHEDNIQAMGMGRMESCRECHNVGYGTGGYISYETTPQFANVQCESCHGSLLDGTSDHPGGGDITATFDAESCGRCHTGSHHPTIDEWRTSGHGMAPMVDEEGEPEHNVTGTSCMKCHNGQAFVSIQVNGEDPPAESLTEADDSMRIGCATCHDPHDATLPHQLRVDPAGTVTFPFDDIEVSAGAGNVCVSCHNGRRTRDDYISHITNGSRYFGTHYGPQGPILFGLNGADMNGGVVAYDTDHPHSGLSDACVNCHMYTADYIDSDNPAITGHSFAPNFEACAGCHGDAATAEGKVATLHTEIEGLLADFVNAWPAAWRTQDPETLEWDLESRDTDPTTGVGPERDDPTGNAYREALWNYYLILDDHSMGVHNPTYVRSLLNESIARLGELSPAPQAYYDADGINGGMLYDKFWATEGGWDQGDPNIATYDASSNFFRCKQCHGWDLLGNQGFYVSRAPSLTRPNVTGLDLHTLAGGMSPQELFDALASPTGRRGIAVDLSTYDPDTNSTDGDMMPDYGALMTDAQIWDIVRFLRETAIDTSTLYDSELTGVYPTGSLAFSNIGLDGDAVAGATVYADNCSACHGADGTTIPLGSRSVGVFIREKANEAQHKVKFGQLGTAMGSLVTDDGDMLDMYKALADDVAFPAL